MTVAADTHTYQLKRYALGRQPSLEITKAEYEAILVAKRHVLEHLTIEELLDLVLGNYEEFERELSGLHSRTPRTLELAMIGALQSIRFNSSVAVLRFSHDCPRVLRSNSHVISSLFGPQSPELTAVRGYFRQEHHIEFGYRFCTELRRYMQHRGTAVHGLNGISRWITRPDGRHVRIYSVAPLANVRRLQEDLKFKPSVLRELETGRDRKPDWRRSFPRSTSIRAELRVCSRSCTPQGARASGRRCRSPRCGDIRRS